MKKNRRKLYFYSQIEISSLVIFLKAEYEKQKSKIFWQFLERFLTENITKMELFLFASTSFSPR